jgi:hypothetical protein
MGFDGRKGNEGTPCVFERVFGNDVVWDTIHRHDVNEYYLIAIGSYD